MSSVIDKFEHHITVEQRKYKDAVETLFGEMLGDLRDRVKEQRDMLGLAKAQVELAQQESKRITAGFETLQKNLDRQTQLLMAANQRVKQLESQVSLQQAHRDVEAEAV